MSEFISGIQQVGIGVTNATEAKMLYKDLFGMNVLIFEDKAEATLMTQYTGRELHSRHAILSLNMGGGGGFEIWQFMTRTGQKPERLPVIGDTGIFAVKIKTFNVDIAHATFSQREDCTVSTIHDSPEQRKHFWLQDNYGNRFNIVEGDDWFKKNDHCGGVAGAVICVSDMDAALLFYKKMVGIDEEVYDITGDFTDFPGAFKEGQRFRRVLLKKQPALNGAFSTLLGGVQLELVQALDHTPGKIYTDRFWGDCGFIHLCFDVLNMDALKARFTENGYTFTVDSAESFSMGESAGRFCYVEDPDGTLIELVETHKVPVMKKYGWYLDLKKRKSNKPLPRWMVGLLALNKIK